MIVSHVEGSGVIALSEDRRKRIGKRSRIEFMAESRAAEMRQTPSSPV